MPTPPIISSRAKMAGKEGSGGIRRLYFDYFGIISINK
jgi:hypothetical protein